MKRWRVLITDPLKREIETFDLSRRRILRVGYDAHNDIAVGTTRVPSTFHQLRRKGSGWVLRVPSDIKASVTGQQKLLKPWKTKLYSGEDVFVDGQCSWRIGDLCFTLQPYERKVLAESGEGQDLHQGKIWARSAAVAFGIFVLMTLGAFTANHFSHSRYATKEVTKEVFIADLAKLQKKVEPPPVKPPEAKPDQKGGGGGQKKSASKPAEGAKGARPRNINAMGILAVTTAVADVGTVQLEAPGVMLAMNTTDDIGFGLGTRGLGAGAAGSGSLVGVEGVSGSGYGGGMGDGVGRGKGSGVGLKRREIEVQGGLDPELIRKVIEERISEIRYCYETELLERPGLAGKIMASWQITADGSVQSVQTQSSEIEKKILHSCVTGRIQSWKFPAPTGGTLVNVKYPFLFSKNDL